MTKKNISKPYYKAIGYSSSNVTGSCHLIRFKDYTIVCEYGMFQNNNPIEEYKVNGKRLKDLKPKEINYVFACHMHCDHIGLLPVLYRDGCTAPCYVPKNSKPLMKIMLMDSVKIMERDQEHYEKRGCTSVKAIYGYDDVDNLLKHVIEIDFNEKTNINSDISFTFYSAQHIVNSAQLLIELKDNNLIKRIGYTSDIGGYKSSKEYIEDFQPIQKCDLLVGEATYSAKTRVNKSKDREKDIEKMRVVIDQCIRNKSKVLIPVFSLERLEDILTVLYDNFSDSLKIPVIIDTPLGVSIGNIWEKIIPKDVEKWQEVWNWKNIQRPQSFKESMAWQQIGGAMIILSSSGMVTAGRSISWAKALLPNSKDHIMFCGYTSERSLASQIKNQKQNKFVKIEKSNIRNKCQITVLNSFSSHADHDELLDYYTTVQFAKICLVHSEQNAKCMFAEELKQALSKQNKTSRVTAANKDTKLYF